MATGWKQGSVNDNPWIKIYPGDWRNNQALQGCSIAARGMWFELLLIMRGCPREGILTSNCAPMPMARVAALTNTTEEEATTLVAELEAAGVIKRLDGCISSRRMRLKTFASQDGKAAAEKRWKARQDAQNATPNGSGPGASEMPHPMGVSHWVPAPDAQNATPNGSPPPPSSSLPLSPTPPLSISPASPPPSSSDFVLGASLPRACARKPQPEPELPKSIDTPAVREALEDYFAARREQHHAKLGPVGLKRLYQRLAEWGPEGAAAALRDSVSNGYQGVFPSKGHPVNGQPKPAVRKTKSVQEIFGDDYRPMAEGGAA